jgi:hypothetical protein
VVILRGKRKICKLLRAVRIIFKFLRNWGLTVSENFIISITVPQWQGTTITFLMEEDMKGFGKTVSLLIFVSLLFLFSGCAKPPEAEQKAAQTAMEAAVAAGADKYATADLEAANKIKATADAQVTEKKYKEAKQAYIDAKAAFEKAAGAVEAGKAAAAAAAVADANAALTSVEETWKAVEADVAKLGKKMKAQKAAWDADSKAFGENLKAAKELVATDALSAKAKAGELKGLAEKWVASLADLAAAPVKAKK